jgi:hypothetical protein
MIPVQASWESPENIDEWIQEKSKVLRFGLFSATQLSHADESVMCAVRDRKQASNP